MKNNKIDRMINILQAYKNGRTIQVNYYKDNNKWEDTDDLSQLSISTVNFFRVKPNYRPFRSNTECAIEITNHSFPGSLLESEYKNTEYSIIQFNNNQSDASWNILIYNKKMTFEEAFNTYIFVDGSPFGVINEE